MTKKRFKKLMYAWFIENRNFYTGDRKIGEILKDIRKVGFKPKIVIPNYHTYQQVWNSLNWFIEEESIELKEDY